MASRSPQSQPQGMHSASYLRILEINVPRRLPLKAQPADTLVPGTGGPKHRGQTLWLLT